MQHGVPACEDGMLARQQQVRRHLWGVGVDSLQVVQLDVLATLAAVDELKLVVPEQAGPGCGQRRPHVCSNQICVVHVLHSRLHTCPAEPPEACRLLRKSGGSVARVTGALLATVIHSHSALTGSRWGMQ